MLQQSLRIRVSYIGLALILFYAYDFFYSVIEKGVSNEFIAKVITLLILYTFYLIACLKSPQKVYSAGFIIIIVSALLFFFTYWLYPEYRRAMISMPSWNIWKSVFTFSSGIFACLFFQMFDDPNKLRKYLKYSGYFLFIWSAFRIRTAITRGGFLRSMENGLLSTNTYDMALGYRLLFVSLIFAIEFQKEKKIIRYLYATISISAFIAMTIYGSRTAVLSFFVFWILKVLFCHEASTPKKRIVNIIFILVAFFTIYEVITNEAILLYFYNVISRMGASSRILNTLISGNIALDKGRSIMWSNALQMILEHPIIGNGIYSDRNEFGIYCHQFVLELFLDFGIIIGTIIIIIFAWSTIKILLKCQNQEWKLMFILFFSMIIIRLNFSSSFWSDTNFWACLIIGSKALRETAKLNISCYRLSGRCY